MKNVVKLNDYVENLKLVLSSPRQRRPGTITSYVQTAKTFLAWLDGDVIPPANYDGAMEKVNVVFRRYFLWRREKKISERTLMKEFSHLQKLALANNWPWPFTDNDKPVSEEEPYAPALLPDQIEQMIRSYDVLTRAERFYLALSTTWGCRREDMAEISHKDYNETEIGIMIAKRRKKIKHLVPEEIRPVLGNFKAQRRTPTSLSIMFTRIVKKAGLKTLKHYGWHSIRRTVDTVLQWNYGQEKIPQPALADYMGWSRTARSQQASGSSMLGHYYHPEILPGDVYGMERLIHKINPFLPLWLEILSREPQTEEAAISSI